MEVLIFQKEAFEEMAAKFSRFSNRVNEILAKQGDKSLNKWMDNQEGSTSCSLPLRGRRVISCIGGDSDGISPETASDGCRHGTSQSGRGLRATASRLPEARSSCGGISAKGFPRRPCRGSHG